MRQDEDWSKYYNNDFKHIKLNEKGDYWVSVGGHVRYRGEFWNNVGFNDANDDAFHLGRALCSTPIGTWAVTGAFLPRLKPPIQPIDHLPGGRQPTRR